MVDKSWTVPREKAGPSFGQLEEYEMLEVTRVLSVFLGIA